MQKKKTFRVSTSRFSLYFCLYCARVCVRLSCVLLGLCACLKKKRTENCVYFNAFPCALQKGTDLNACDGIRGRVGTDTRLSGRGAASVWPWQQHLPLFWGSQTIFVCTISGSVTVFQSSRNNAWRESVGFSNIGKALKNLYFVYLIVCL